VKALLEGGGPNDGAEILVGPDTPEITMPDGSVYRRQGSTNVFVYMKPDARETAI
jgi:hypothetical protein